MNIREITKALQKNQQEHQGDVVLTTAFGYQIEPLLQVLGTQGSGFTIRSTYIKEGETTVSVSGSARWAGITSSELMLEIYENNNQAYYKIGISWRPERAWQNVMCLPRTHANHGSRVAYYQREGQEISVLQDIQIKKLSVSFDTSDYVENEERNEENCLHVVMETDISASPLYEEYYGREHSFLNQSRLVMTGTVKDFFSEGIQFAVTAEFEAPIQNLNLQFGTNLSAGRVVKYGLLIKTHVMDELDVRNYEENVPEWYYVSKVWFKIFVDFGIKDFPEIFLTQPLFTIGQIYELYISFGAEGLGLEGVTALIAQIIGAGVLEQVKKAYGLLGKVRLYSLIFRLEQPFSAMRIHEAVIDIGMDGWQTPFSFLYMNQIGLRIIVSSWGSVHTEYIMLYGKFTLFQKLVLQGSVALPSMEFDARACIDTKTEKLALREAIPSELFPEQSLYLMDVRAYGNFKAGDYWCSMQVNTEDILSFSIGGMKIALASIYGSLNYVRGELSYGISGILKLGEEGGTQILLAAGASMERSLWSFRGSLASEKVSLTSLAEQIIGYRPPVELDITRMDLYYRTDGQYFINGALQAEFPVFGREEWKIKASAFLTNQTGHSGSYFLRVSGELEFYEFQIGVIVCMEKGAESEYELAVRFRDMYAHALYKDNQIMAELENISVGGILTMLFQVITPNVSFTLPSPWDVLNRIGFKQVNLWYNLDTKEIMVALELGINLGIIQLRALTMTYKKGDSGKPSFEIGFDITGARDDAYVWDVFGNQPIPSLMGDSQEDIFKLDYFGISHHVNVGGVEKDQPLKLILEKIRERVKPSDGYPEIAYDLQTGFFIGASFTVMGSLELTLLFYDPVIYGAQLAIKNDKVLPFAGLEITMYYRKVKEGIGLFFIDLTLPDRLRQMEFGTFSISLPRIQVWIYTNGNFKFNFGFPEGGDFSQSAGLAMGLYYGKGGFYFGYLNGDTSDQVPEVTNGFFSPVIEIGIGILAGIGKSLNLGVLKLKAALEIKGIFQGVFAQFHEKNTEETAVYYRCYAMVSVMGEISGEVDFFVIKAGFHISLYVAAALTLEACEQTLLEIEAEIRVSAYVKILFFKVNFSFSFRYKDQFLLGEKKPSLWNRTKQIAEKKLWLPWKEEEFVFSIKAYLPEIGRINVALSPIFGRKDFGVQWQREAEKPSGEAVLGAFMAVPLENMEAFFTMLLLFVWEAAAPGQEQVPVQRLKSLNCFLQNHRPDAFEKENMYQLLTRNICFVFQEADCMVQQEQAVAMLPVSSSLQLTFFQLQQELPVEQSLQGDELLTDNFLLDSIYLLTRIICAAAADLEDGEITKEVFLGHMQKMQESCINQWNHFMLQGIRIREAKGEETGIFEKMGQQFVCFPNQVTDPKSAAYELRLTESEHQEWIELPEDFAVRLTGEEAVFPGETLQAGEIAWMKPWKKTEGKIAFKNVTVIRRKQEISYLWECVPPEQDLTDYRIELWNTQTLVRINRKGHHLSTDMAAIVPEGIVTRIELVLQKTDTAGVSQIYAIPADSQEKLRQLLGRNEFPVTGGRLLFPLAVAQNQGKGLGDYQIPEETMVLIHSNLSQVTTAPKLEAEEEAYCVCLKDGYAAFLQSLLRAGEISGMGHYLRYQGEEIPEEIFDDDGQCRAVFLLETGKVIAACTDAMIWKEKVPEEQIPVLISSQLSEEIAETMEPGSLGFVMRMAKPQEKDMVYRTLYCRKEEKNGTGVLFPPIAMKDGETEEEWSFDYTFSYYKYMEAPVIHGKLSETSSEEYQLQAETDAYPSQEENPYRGIVMSENPPAADFSFFMADVMGNASSEESTYQVKKLLYYEDGLISPEGYPLTRWSYETGRTEEAGCMRMVIRAVPDAEAWKEELEKTEHDPVMKCLARAYYQLQQQDVQIRCFYRLGEKRTAAIENIDKEPLITYLGEAYAALHDIGRNDGEKIRNIPEKVEFILKFPLPVAEEECTIRSWKVELELTRAACLVNPDSPVENIGSVCCELKNEQEEEVFANQLEQAIPNSKLLDCNGWYLALIGEKKPFFRIYAENENNFFALPPINRELVTRTQVKVDKQGTSVDYTDVDTEIWMQDFLGFYEKVLSPEGLEGILESSEEWEKRIALINALLRLKKRLAGSIAEHMSEIYPQTQTGSITDNMSEIYPQTQTGSITDNMSEIYPQTQTEQSRREAVKALANEMEKNLYGGYQVSGCYCYRTVLEDCSDYNLEGTISQKGIKPGKIQADTSYTPFLLAPGNPEAQAEISMAGAAFSIRYIEDRRNSRWYRMVIPWDEKNASPQMSMIELEQYAAGGTVVIPSVLRQYPDRLVLKEQKWESGKLEELGHITWKYGFSIEGVLLAQDRVYVSYYWNEKSLQRNVRDGEDLFDYLAWFSYHKAEWEKSLDNAENVYDTVNEFFQLAHQIEQVADTWKNEMEQEPQMVLYPLFKEGILTGIQIEGREIENVRLICRDINGNERELVREENTNQYLLPPESGLLIKAGEKAEYEIWTGELDIFQRQSAKAGVYLTRNEYFTDGSGKSRRVNEAFVYRTPEQCFNNVLQPVVYVPKSRKQEVWSVEAVEAYLKLFQESLPMQIIVSCGYGRYLYPIAAMNTSGGFMERAEKVWRKAEEWREKHVKEEIEGIYFSLKVIQYTSENRILIEAEKIFC